MGGFTLARADIGVVSAGPGYDEDRRRKFHHEWGAVMGGRHYPATQTPVIRYTCDAREKGVRC